METILPLMDKICCWNPLNVKNLIYFLSVAATIFLLVNATTIK